jgi:hypothetical protein
MSNFILVVEVVRMSVAFDRAREFIDQRVRMVFVDAQGRHELVATLLFATEEMDKSQHLIDDKLEWTSDPGELGSTKDSTFHAEGELLVSIEAAPKRR